jgi:hypothetical protein
MRKRISNTNIYRENKNYNLGEMVNIKVRWELVLILIEENGK